LGGGRKGGRAVSGLSSTERSNRLVSLAFSEKKKGGGGKRIKKDCPAGRGGGEKRDAGQFSFGGGNQLLSNAERRKRNWDGGGKGGAVDPIHDGVTWGI